MAIELKIRDVRTGEARVASFESVGDAENWLRERPRFTEVLGPARHGAIPPGDEIRLREAMRPLDEEERAAQVEQDERSAQAIRKMMAGEQERMRQEMEARREANRDADPNRPMVVGFERGKGMSNGDPADDREVTEVARKAVLAWVAERDTWVHSRGQYVASAQVVVWPGPLPSGTSEDERVQAGGQFQVLAGTAPELN
ncbi:hypothetical protein [Paraliomyxa miuraensis]|uniref:hypothetical protein n=1 Tax=Paraliomyxa miuraensis TaxID=376150 RepID=UPI002255918F|nr:hypothetical protein [Paraliomyxa miuraensis]MCX4247891.1 hypothetical protein [Paraliomyxa miuraensis]